MTENINIEQQKAVLIGIITQDISEDELQASLDELERLCDTAGIISEARLTQSRPKPEPGTYIGVGKLDELKEIVDASGINLAVIDDELSPSQIRNIEDKLDIEVIDRTMLILEIFANHAHSSEGKLQVEIAQLRYTAPRLTGKGKDMTRIGGGGVGGGGSGGTGVGGGVGGARRGGGESKLEIDRRIIRSTIAALEKEIAQLEKTRGLMRSRREKTGVPSISIAGYTNSGKSTLLNYLTRAGVLAENKLFATLDPTTRKLKLPNGTEVLLTDTVGLIKKLPHHLVRAFKSTLDEIIYADIILLVADISDPEHPNQIEVTRSLLAEMGASDKPFIIVYNKIDAVSQSVPPVGAGFHARPQDATDVDADMRNGMEAVPYNISQDDIYISARTGEGVDSLLEKIQEVLESQRKPVTFIFELNGREQAHISNLYKTALVSDIEYSESNVTVQAVADEKTRSMYAEFLG